LPAPRIIPCLDVKDGRVVKGVRFRNHRDVGDIVDCALRYCDEGADELVFYDITASADRRSVGLQWIERVSCRIDIPFCVAGGIRSVDQARQCLARGADKISVNSPAIERPELIAELAEALGSQCVVLGVDSQETPSGYRVKQYTGSEATTRDAGLSTVEWVKRAQSLGAGEIVLNCMSRDGVRTGYDLAHVREVAEAVTLPVIASGGAGDPSHFRDIFAEAGASGALAASVFHDRKIFIPALKEYLASCGIEMRR
jgi:cyclase